MEDDFSVESRPVKKLLIWVAVFLFVISGIVWFCNRGARVLEEGRAQYEEFQDIYNSCEKINTDLCNMRKVDPDDPMFEQFSKTQRILVLQTNLNRWVQDYNAKSKTWTRSAWKGGKLPYQLSVEEFNCYEPQKQPQ